MPSVDHPSVTWARPATSAGVIMTWIRWLSLTLFGVYLFGAPAHAD